MQETDATMITSLRSNNAYVAACRIRSISSLMDASFSMYVLSSQVRLRLVVVVVADEILHRVLGEEHLELGV